MEMLLHTITLRTEESQEIDILCIIYINMLGGISF